MLSVKIKDFVQLLDSSCKIFSLCLVCRIKCLPVPLLKLFVEELLILRITQSAECFQETILFFPHQQVSHPEDHFDSSYNAVAVLQGYMYSSWTGGPGQADSSRPLSPLDSSLKLVPIHNLYARNLSSRIYPWFS